MYTNHCQGISSYTLWTNYSANTMTMQINTSKCAFQQTPVYFTSITGTNAHWTLIGSNAIYQRTNESFQIYIRFHNTVNMQLLLNYSIQFQRNVNWIGATTEKRTYNL